MNILERTYKAINHEEVYPVPVVLWDLAPWMPSMFNINVKKYYQDFELKLATQLKLQETFPDVLFFPGLHPDFGVIIQPSAFGGRIQWMDNDAPYVHPCLDGLQDIDKIKPIDPSKDGLMPTVLKEWKMMWNKVDRRLVNEYGYLDGHALCMGPPETAGLLLGYDKFFLGLYEEPQKINRLLSIITEETIKWVKYQEKINGKLKRLFLFDHLSTQISPEHYKEFFHPYVKAIYNEFSYSEIRLWHNEGRSKHIFDYLTRLGCNIYNFGDDDLGDIKNAIGDKVCLMGNLDGVKVIRNQSVENIKAIVKNCIEVGGKDGGYLISGAGGLSAGTTKEKIHAIVEASMDINSK